MKRLLLFGAVLAASVGAGAPAASAQAPFASCGVDGLVCGTLNVPLDYANPTAGQVPLYVEELPAVGKPRGVMIMLAGGPGQASAETFNLGRKAAYWRSFFPGYTLVAYDDRGTGKSGALDCPRAQTVAACGSAIAGRAYYTTREHGEDIESVRLALGVDKVARLGRLLRDEARGRLCARAPRPRRAPAARLRGVARQGHSRPAVAARRAGLGERDLRRYNPCAGIAPGAGDRLVQLANQLQAHPVTASISLRPDTRAVPGRPRRPGTAVARLRERPQLGVSSQLPAAIDAALAGWMLPLERLDFLDQVNNTASGGATSTSSCS